MKALLTDKNKVKFLLFNGYEIRSGKKEEYEFDDLPEELCKKMCKEHDAGKQFSPSSRFTYTADGYDDYKGIPFGTAKAIIQTIVIDNFEREVKDRVSINKHLLKQTKF